MDSHEKIKTQVKEKYSEIAMLNQVVTGGSCCNATGCGTDFTNFSEDYTRLEGYNPGADLGLGCGLPTEFAHIKEGHTVLDLGSGAGNDCFVARAITGEKGRVIGVDMTDSMIERARSNAQQLGFTNVEFHLGEIEQLPLEDNLVDVVVSNCVLNLVPDKVRAFAETFRVLKPGGHFSISDIVLQGELPEVLKQAAELYAGCVSGAIQKEEYLALIGQAGFGNIKIQKEREIVLPDELLLRFLSAEELDTFKKSKLGIFSITVYGEKPAACCNPGCCLT